ncbi:MAG: methenyltetrahydromethanopterin cyclohydrolase [Anaerolineaceae bacterium]|nr:methenyltetrahydromethanopterin cyclohydrolase [Anaerolineaceae bacterium]
MISVNRQSLKIIQEQILPNPDLLKIDVKVLSNGATVIDMGQKVEGSWEAGRLFAQITQGGIVDVTFGHFQLGDFLLPSINVLSPDAFISGWVCQRHAEPLPGSDHQPILTGPAKALLYPPDLSIVFAEYKDDSPIAVAPLQTSEPITEEITAWIAASCRVDPKNLYVLVAPSMSLVCSIQVAARPIDNLMHRLQEENFDIKTVRGAFSTAPLPPLSPDEIEAMGRINDALLYGGHVFVYVESTDEEIKRILPKLTLDYTGQYGKLFKQMYIENDQDFHKMDLRVHTTALIQVNNLKTGHTFSTGKIDREILYKSFFGG